MAISITPTAKSHGRCHSGSLQAFHQYVEFLELVTDQQHWWPGVSVLLHQLQEFLRLRSQAAISVLFSFSNGRQQTSQLSLASAHGIHLASEWLRLLQAQLSAVQSSMKYRELICFAATQKHCKSRRWICSISIEIGNKYGNRCSIC